MPTSVYIEWALYFGICVRESSFRSVRSEITFPHDVKKMPWREEMDL